MIRRLIKALKAKKRKLVFDNIRMTDGSYGEIVFKMYVSKDEKYITFSSHRFRPINGGEVYAAKYTRMFWNEDDAFFDAIENQLKHQIFSIKGKQELIRGFKRSQFSKN